MNPTEDQWTWAHEEAAPGAVVTDTSGVVGVLVVHNAGAWLARTLVALARLDDRPGRLIAVDTGSVDESASLLAKARHEGLLDDVVTTEPTLGFGAAVERGLAALPEGFEPRWLWLMHDDMAPRRRALTELLATGESARAAGEPEVAIVVPKLLMPKLRNYPDRIAEIGQSTSRSGRRILSPAQNVDVGDLDQHQLDSAPVLGASTAGMLVRWSAWRALGGLDPALPLFRDGLDLGWRAHEAGLAVVTAPAAGIEHRQAGRWDDRPEPLAQDPAALDRQLASRVLAAHSAAPGRTLARLRAGSLTGVLGFVLGKDLSRARGHWRAFLAGRGDRDVVEAMLARPSAGQGVPEGLLPTRAQSLRAGGEHIAASLTDRVRDLGPDQQASIDDLTGDDYSGSSGRRPLVSPEAVVALLVVLLTLVSARQLGGFGALAGPALPPAPSSLAAAWGAWWHPVAGVPGTSAPWLLAAALGSTLTFGQPGLFAVLLVLAGPALAMLTGLRFARRVAGPGWPALAVAAVWGLALPLTGLTGSGSIGGAVAGIMAPLWATSVHTWFTRDADGPDRWRAPGTVALTTSVIAACYPAFWLAGLGAALVAVLALKRGRRPALVPVLAPLLVMAGWLPSLLSSPGRLLTGPDPTYQPAGQAPPVLDALLGRTGPGAAPLWAALVVVAGVWLIGAVVAVSSRGPDAAAVGLVAVAGTCLVLSVVLARTLVQVDGVQVRPASGLWTLLALGAVLTLIARGAAGLRPKALVATTTALGLLSVLAAGWWTWGATAPLRRGDSVLPGYVRASIFSPRQARVLMLDLSGSSAAWSVAAPERPGWGSGEHHPVDGSAQITGRLTDVVRQIAQGTLADDLSARLTELGISYLWIQGGSADLGVTLANTGGLTAAPLAGRSTVWTVAGLASRASIQSGDSSTPVVGETIEAASIAAASTEAGASGRRLVLAEPVDSRWRATLDGRRLTPVAQGWRQGFELPADAGRLSWTLAPTWGWSLLQLMVLAVCGVLAAPSVKPSGPTARRAR